LWGAPHEAHRPASSWFSLPHAEHVHVIIIIIPSSDNHPAPNSLATHVRRGGIAGAETPPSVGAFAALKMVHFLQRWRHCLQRFEPGLKSRVRRVDLLEKAQSCARGGAKQRRRGRPPMSANPKSAG
jgi:hypothetical protein